MEGIQGQPLQPIKPTMPNSILPGGVKIPGGQDQGKSFFDTLNDSIQEINKLQMNANEQVQKLARGEVKDVHQVMIAAQEASLSFSMMMQVRNKIVDAYQEIIKM